MKFSVGDICKVNISHTNPKVIGKLVEVLSYTTLGYVNVTELGAVKLYSAFTIDESCLDPANPALFSSGPNAGLTAALAKAPLKVGDICEVNARGWIVKILTEVDSAGIVTAHLIADSNKLPISFFESDLSFRHRNVRHIFGG